MIGPTLEIELFLEKSSKAEFGQYTGPYWLQSNPSCMVYPYTIITWFHKEPFLGPAPRIRNAGRHETLRYVTGNLSS